MKILIILIAGINVAINAQAQNSWSLYLGENTDSIYTTGVSRSEMSGPFMYRYFEGYRFVHHPESRHALEKTNRDGVILDAKSTTTYISKGEVISSKDNDSVVISYESETDLVYHGRSAALSVINFLSKKENKVKQDKPSEEIRSQRVIGMIRYDADHFSFEKNWLQLGNDTVWVTGAQQIIKQKNGKIKKANGNEGLQLMRGADCIAAISYYDFPEAYYLSRKLTDKEKLIIIAFLQTRELMLQPL